MVFVSTFFVWWEDRRQFSTSSQKRWKLEECLERIKFMYFISQGKSHFRVQLRVKNSQDYNLVGGLSVAPISIVTLPSCSKNYKQLMVSSCIKIAPSFPVCELSKYSYETYKCSSIYDGTIFLETNHKLTILQVENISNTPNFID